MILFLLKGLIRDRHRSLFPFIVVSMGVMLTVLMSCWVQGVMGDVVESNARFTTGHVSVSTVSFSENRDQLPVDLALLDINALTKDLQTSFPSYRWVQRTQFGTLVDVPDQNGETRTQGPAMAMAIDFHDSKKGEIERLGILKSLQSGKLPASPGEILLSQRFAEKLDLAIGNEVTLMTSTMNGSMGMQNFTLSGTVEFGMDLLDRGAVILDLNDAQQLLDMEDGCSEILGFGKSYIEEEAAQMVDNFNAMQRSRQDQNEFSPIMVRLSERPGIGEMMAMTDVFIGMAIGVFVIAMSIVLWNTGLIGGLRRYGEIGVRLAMGETKTALYQSMIAESILIGFFGTLAGTTLGLILGWYLQEYGIDIGFALKNATMMFPNVFRAKITPQALFIGFLPGLGSTVLGTCLAGIGIFKRNTAQLFKELES